jgi:hypothetical protein
VIVDAQEVRNLGLIEPARIDPETAVRLVGQRCIEADQEAAKTHLADWKEAISSTGCRIVDLALLEERIG